MHSKTVFLLFFFFTQTAATRGTHKLAAGSGKVSVFKWLHGKVIIHPPMRMRCPFAMLHVIESCLPGLWES